MNKGISTRHRFGPKSERELREAQLFWSRLTGEQPPRASSRLLRASVEAYDSESEAEQTSELYESSGETHHEHADETLPPPLAVLPGDPVPFAPQPPAGSFWPVVTSHARSREVNYQAQDGSFVGANRGRGFVANRTSGARYHVGVDLFANAGDPVVAVSDGRIVAFYGFCCGDNQTTNALIVDHGNVVVNYGEVAPDSLSRNGLRVGSSVQAGNVIAYIGVNPGGDSMLHFETYTPGTRANQRWPRNGQRPAAVLNPTPYLIWLVENGRAPSARGAQASAPTTPTPVLPPTAGSPPPTVPAPTSTRDWTTTHVNERMRYVVGLLVSRYGYSAEAAAGIVGNLNAESNVLPSRLERSDSRTPLRAPNFDGVVTNFSAEQIMNRSTSRREGPRAPGVGLAQWTSSERRAGLFRHSYQGRTLGASILFDMDAQVDYLVSELAARYRPVDQVLRGPNVTLDAASDEVVYRFEIPGSILTASVPRKKLPRTDPAVVAIFTRRRTLSAEALAAYRQGTRSEDWSSGESWSEQVDEEGFKQAVLEQQSRNAQAAGRTRYAPVPDSELSVVEGRHRLRTEAAEQCRALLSAVRAALAEAQRGGDSNAVRVTQIGIVSSYRDPVYDGRLWHQYYPRYYRETQAQRDELVGGPHGDAAVRYLARYISQRKAAPGFSNHSDARAVDFITTEGGVAFGASTSQRSGWRRTWLHRWLVPNAERYGFYPLSTEEWHWDYRMGSRS